MYICMYMHVHKTYSTTTKQCSCFFRVEATGVWNVTPQENKPWFWKLSWSRREVRKFSHSPHASYKSHTACRRRRPPCCFSWRHRSRKSSRLSFICKQKPVGVDVNSCWSRENQTALACNLFTFPCVHLKWKRSELKLDEGRYCTVFNVCEMMTNRAIDSCFHDLVLRRNLVKTRLPLVAVVFCALYSSCTATNTRTRQERSEKLSQSVTQNQQVWITRLEQKHVALNVHVNRANTTVTSCSGNYAGIKFRLSTVCTRKEPVHSWARGIDRVQRAL